MIAPDTPFGAPRHVWVPVPPGAEIEHVAVYYLDAGGTETWYLAEEVHGWLVPQSYDVVEDGDVLFLGLSVNHGGIIRLGPQPAQDKQVLVAAAVMPVGWVGRDAVVDILLLAITPLLLVAIGRARRRGTGAKA